MYLVPHEATSEQIINIILNYFKIFIKIIYKIHNLFKF